MTQPESDDPERDGETTTTDGTAPEPTAHTTSSWKILGEIADSSGAGIVGHNTAGSGSPKGIVGAADSTNTGSHAVRGEVSGGNAKGVKGLNVADPGDERFFGAGAGVYGQNDQSFGYGVVGYNNSSTGSRSVGVLGQTDSPESPAIWAYNANGVGSKVTGYQEVSKTTLSAYLGTAQTVATTAFTDIEFDSIVANHFPGSAFDSNTGAFTVPIAGTYHVSAGLGWDTNFSAGDGLFSYITVNSSRKAKNFRVIGAAVSPNVQCAKTLVDLAENDVIRVQTFQTSGSDQTLATGEQETYVTIDKIG